MSPRADWTNRLSRAALSLHQGGNLLDTSTGRLLTRLAILEAQVEACVAEIGCGSKLVETRTNREVTIP